MPVLAVGGIFRHAPAEAWRGSGAGIALLANGKKYTIEPVRVVPFWEAGIERVPILMRGYIWSPRKKAEIHLTGVVPAPRRCHRDYNVNKNRLDIVFRGNGLVEISLCRFSNQRSGGARLLLQSSERNHEHKLRFL